MPSALLHSSTQLLEFEQFRELLLGYASSPLGKERISQLGPCRDQAWIVEQQELTSEIAEFRRAGGRLEFAGLLDVTQLAAMARAQLR